MELFRALGALAERPGPETERLADLLDLGRVPTEEEYTALFCLELPPYASVYLSPDGMLGGEARDQVAGFWRAVGRDPPDETDHVAVLLATYAGLADLETVDQEERLQSAVLRMRSAFLWEHLLSWLPVFLDAVCAVGAEPYRQWGLLVGEALATEARRVPPPDRLPLPLRQHSAAMDAGADGPDEVLAWLLAPLRSGMILTRSDLTRAGRELGMACRAGERRFVLRAFLDQNSSRVWPWLAKEAARWADRHDARRSWLAAVATEWSARATRTATLVGGLTPYGAVR